ncbi:MAG: glycine-rich protein [Bacteroidota bacterium]|nr:glycine-rich protein [Bacteroidota bacterium]
MIKKLQKIKRYLASGVFSVVAITSVNAQCLGITCPGNMTVSAPTSSCGAMVNYSLPVYNNACSTQTFNFTGVMQTYTVPVGVTSLTITAMGAQGANQTPGGTGGLGGSAQGVLSVSAGQVLNIFVGGQNGYNGGALGGVNGNTVFSAPSTGTAGNGGGATDIRIGGVALANRVFVAGGGGGAAHNGVWPSCQTAGPAGNGGSGGGLTGGNGSGGSSTACNCTGGGGNGGFGGTQSAGGATSTYNSGGCLQTWGPGNAGTLGIGGAGSSVFHNGSGGCGGGGGGYYGGGSGANGSDTTPGGGGGGGSSFVGTATNTILTAGTNTGNGKVIITSPSVATNTLTQIAGLASGSTFSIGTNVQTFSVTDGANSNTCSFSVTVIDAITPTITCPGNVNQCTALVSSIAPVSVLDNCPSPNVTYALSGATTGTGITNASGTFSTGITNVTYTAMDASGNSGTCSFSVNITVGPTVTATSNASLICVGQTATLTASGANTYTWNTAATSTVIAVSPTVTTSYTVTGSNGGTCTVAYVITQSVSACTGINGVVINNPAIEVFPNPNNGEFNVNLNSVSENTFIEVYNSIGQLITKEKTTRLNNSLNLKNEANGIYIIKIIENGELIQKSNFIKQ